MWKNVEDQCRMLYEYHHINGHNPLERKRLIGLIAEEFPNYTRMRIAHAVDQCLKTDSQPMRPNTFINTVKSYLQ